MDGTEIIVSFKVIGTTGRRQKFTLTTRDYKLVKAFKQIKWQGDIYGVQNNGDLVCLERWKK